MTAFPIQPEDLYNSKWVSDPTIAPDGTIVYVHRTIDREANTYRTRLHMIAPGESHAVELTTGETDAAPAWSPDGSRLAFLRRTDGKPQLWILHAHQSEPQLTVSLEHGINSFAWSPDSKQLVLIGRTVFGNGEGIMKPKQGRVMQRTMQRAEGSGWWDGYIQHVWLYELDQDQPPRQITDGQIEALSAQFSPDGKRIAYIGKKIPSINNMQIRDYVIMSGTDADQSPFQDLCVLDIASGQSQRCTEHNLAISQFGWTVDSTGWLLIANDRQYGSGTQNRVYHIQESPAGGSWECMMLTPDTDIQIGNFILNDIKMSAARPGPIVSSDGQFAYVIGTYAGSAQIYRIDLQQPHKMVAITAGERDIHQFVMMPDEQGIIALEATPEHPYELAVWTLAENTSNNDDKDRLQEANQASKLSASTLPSKTGESLLGQSEESYSKTVHTDQRTLLTMEYTTWLQERMIAMPEMFQFENKAGQQVQCWLIRPSGFPAHQKRPLVLNIHGGPHAMYSGVYSHEMQTQAALGYHVLLVNPRGSFGYGQTFAAACRGDFGGGDYDDVLQAVDEAIQRYGDEIDNERIAVCGGSYGGLMTNWIITHDDRFRAAVSQRCISNWVSFYGTSDIGTSYTQAMAGATPWTDAALLWQRSPVAYANQAYTPLLLIHGEQDLRCPIEQGEQMYSALRHLGKPVRMVRYPDSNHNVLKSGKPSYRVNILREVNEWLVHWLDRKVDVYEQTADRPSSSPFTGEPGRIRLPIPVGLWLENGLSTGLTPAVIAQHIHQRNWNDLLSLAADPQMDMEERLQTALEGEYPWEQALYEGFHFTFIHIGGVRRLLYFRWGLQEGEHYTWKGNHIYNLRLEDEQRDSLQCTIGEQWAIRSLDSTADNLYEIYLCQEQTYFKI